METTCRRIRARAKKADSEQSAASTCRVVNVKVAHIRPKYQNLQEWMQDTANNVSIGRSGVVFIDKQRFSQVRRSVGQSL